MASPEKVAAIDIGTNSIHMVIARVASNGRFEVLTRQKEVVRLGSGRGEMKELAEDAMERGIACLKRCSALAESYGSVVRAVATSAVREAANGSEFIARARSEAGIEIELVSGTEEARLIYLGVLQALPLFDDHVVCIDVGGGSTEVIFGHRGDVTYAISQKLGAIRVTDKFFPGGIASAEGVARCRRYLRSKLAGMAYETAELERTIAIASSGTAENLAAMASSRRAGLAPVRLNGMRVTVTELGQLVAELATVPDPQDRRRVEGLDPARADIILAGAIVLEEVCAALGIEEFLISDFALREGVMLDTLDRIGMAHGERLADLRRSSVFHLMEICDDDPDHSVQVARLSRSLWAQLAPLLGLPDESEMLLECAALLANVGLFVAHSAHHKHSYYVIRNTDHLMGFNNREVELIAQIARHHRKSAPSEVKHPEFAALSEEDRRLVRCCSAILRLAIGLDRNHDSSVAELRVEAGDSEIEILLEPRGLSDLSMECYSATERSGSLADCADRTVVVRATSAQPRP